MMNSDSIKNQIDIHLEEYKTLANEINSRLSHQQQLLRWSLLLFAGISSLLFSFSSKLYTLTSSNLEWILLLIPLLFIAIAFDYQSQYYMMAHLGRYTNWYIRPKLSSLLRLRPVRILAWEDYLYKSRMKSGISEKIAWNSSFLIIFLMALLIFVFIIVQLVRFNIDWKPVDLFLITFEGMALVFLLYSNYSIAKLFMQIPLPYLKEKTQHKS